MRLVPGVERAPSVVFPRERGQGHGWRVGTFVGPEVTHCADERIAVDAGHPDVGHHDVGPLVPEQPDALICSRGGEHARPATLQEMRGDLARIDIVIHDEDGQAFSGLLLRRGLRRRTPVPQPRQVPTAVPAGAP